MNLKLIKKLCSLRESKLEKVLLKYLYSKRYKIMYEPDMYIMAEGNLPICLIAHMDTVFRFLPEEFFYDQQKKVLWSPGGTGFDDRAGIYAILEILEAGYRPSIIFTNKEESGGVGAKNLIQKYPDCFFEDCRALIELDRANKKDAVFYDCDNEDFIDFITGFGFELEWGTFSDISIIAPAWGMAAVNLSIGYEDEHTASERLRCDWCDATIKKVKKILDVSEKMKSYAYIPYIYNRYGHLAGAHNKCLLCDTVLVGSNRHYIPDSAFPYYVCNKCFDEYYAEDKVAAGVIY